MCVFKPHIYYEKSVMGTCCGTISCSYCSVFIEMLPEDVVVIRAAHLLILGLMIRKRKKVVHLHATKKNI